jgi:formylmethanofuran dehydrogenase subunit E
MNKTIHKLRDLQCDSCGAMYEVEFTEFQLEMDNMVIQPVKIVQTNTCDYCGEALKNPRKYFYLLTH